MFTIYFNTRDMQNVGTYIGNWQSFPQADRAFAHALWNGAFSNYRNAPIAPPEWQGGDTDTRAILVDVVNPQTNQATTPADLIGLWRRYVVANPPTPAMKDMEGGGVTILNACASQIEIGRAH